MDTEALATTEESIAGDEVVNSEVAASTATAAPLDQGYRARYNETIAPPGGPSSRVVKQECLGETV